MKDGYRLQWYVYAVYDDAEGLPEMIASGVGKTAEAAEQMLRVRLDEMMVTTRERLEMLRTLYPPGPPVRE